MRSKEAPLCRRQWRDGSRTSTGWAPGNSPPLAPTLLADRPGQPDVRQAVASAMAAVRRPGYDQAARMLAGGRLLEDAAKIDVPTAVLVGSKTTSTPTPHR